MTLAKNVRVGMKVSFRGRGMKVARVGPCSDSRRFVHLYRGNGDCECMPMAEDLPELRRSQCGEFIRRIRPGDEIISYGIVAEVRPEGDEIITLLADGRSIHWAADSRLWIRRQ